jgi:hypothetical protein
MELGCASCAGSLELMLAMPRPRSVVIFGSSRPPCFGGGRNCFGKPPAQGRHRDIEGLGRAEPVLIQYLGQQVLSGEGDS